MNTNEFAKDKEIDPGQLDLECVQQAALFFKWAQRAIVANAEADQAKLHLTVIEAKLEMECRKSPEDFGVIKATEASIAAAVKAHPKYQKAFNHFYTVRKDAKLLDAAVAAMEQRKRMIEVLITLHGQQYFAGPSVPRDLVGAWREHQGRTTETVNRRQRGRARRRGESR